MRLSDGRRLSPAPSGFRTNGKAHPTLLFQSDECGKKLSKVISYDDAIELLRRDFPSKHDMFVRERMKKQRESMVMNVSAEEMPAQLRKAAKSVSVTFLVELCKS